MYSNDSVVKPPIESKSRNTEDPLVEDYSLDEIRVPENHFLSFGSNSSQGSSSKRELKNSILSV